MPHDEITQYYVSREAEEREHARLATSPRSQVIHAELADVYAHIVRARQERYGEGLAPTYAQQASAYLGAVAPNAAHRSDEGDSAGRA